MVVELAERHDRGLGRLEGRGRGTPEVPHAVPDERAGRCRGPQRLPTDYVGGLRWLAGQRRPPGAVADGLVARLVDPAHVDATGHRAGGFRWRRATPTPDDTRFEWGLVGAAPTATCPIRATGERGIGVVDLGHPPGRHARCGRIVAGQVGMVGPREAAP